MSDRDIEYEQVVSGVAFSKIWSGASLPPFVGPDSAVTRGAVGNAYFGGSSGVIGSDVFRIGSVDS
jgi:hypothetical protein